MELVRDLRDLRHGDVAVAGGKGANLGELIAAGLPVPGGFVVTTAAYRQFFAAGEVPDELRTAVLAAYAELGEPAVAVRSSATAEDLAEASFAGQQETYLNVRGADALLAAVRDCWASLWGDRAVDYRSRHGVDPTDIALAVVVQELVAADASGVMFTANPENGRRDETVIAAAWGLGESVVGGTVDADQLVVAGGLVRERRTGDKAIRTVTADRGTHEVPVPESERGAPVLDDAAALELALLGDRAAAHFGAPQDLEWVLAHDVFWIVQSRPITALPEPVGPVPDHWPVPTPHSMYFRASIVEQLPDPLSPLFAELSETAIPRSIEQLMNEIAGHDLVRPHDVGFPTINGYAYYRYDVAALGKMLWATPGLFRKLLARGLTTPVEDWRQVAHPRYVAVVERWRQTDLGALDSPALLEVLAELVLAGARYYNAVQTIIPLAATSEILFTRAYDLLVKRPGDPPAMTFLLGFDSAPILAEKSLYDLARSVPEDSPQWPTLFAAHLDRYGHTVYNLDPVNPVPADDPEPLLAAVATLRGGGGSDPYERQRRSVRQREEATAATLARLDPVRARLFRALLGFAQAVGPIREDALADVGLGWPRLRAVARELGDRLVTAGAIADSDDIWWLRREEIERAAPVADLVRERKQRWRGQRRANPPQMLPTTPWLTWMESMMPAASIDQVGDEIRGISGSGGTVTGVARVLAGPQDFGRLQPGEILIASITTPAWTPLFAIAGGVVTDIGGPLSHSSIVAREYGIPAVLGTGVGTRAIPDGASIEVDGDRGRVRIVERDGSP